MMSQDFHPLRRSAPLAGIALCFAVGALRGDEPAAPDAAENAAADAAGEVAPAETADAPQPAAWRALFDGESLAGWEVIDYAGQGAVKIADGAIHLGQGETLTGVRYVGGDLPKENYEIELRARRMAGSDFFCCLTFPFRDAHASLVLGGWGGAVVGISSINYMDAAENMTTKIREFETGKWYSIRLRATRDRIQAWIDDSDQVVDVNVKDKKVTMRFGAIEESVPLGISTFATAGEARDVRIRALTDAEIAAAEALDEDEF